ncbi:MAG: DNA methyltransferase [Candidatus Helarchaeota archaeon]
MDKKEADPSRISQLWTIPKTILRDISQNPNYKPSASNIIQRTSSTIQELLEKAHQLYRAGHFIECAKVFRQLGRQVRDLEFEIECKGNYDPRNTLNDLTGKEWLRHTKSWLVVDGKPSDIPNEIKNHPASFPPDLAKHFIRFFTKTGDWVFDPFMGIGSTLVACMELKRNCWGTELNSQFAEYAQQRITKIQTRLDQFLPSASASASSLTLQVFNADCRECIQIWHEHEYPPVKFTITSPPYWNMLADSRGGVKSAMKQRIEQGFNQTYSNDSRDLGNISNYQQYLEELFSIFSQIKALMAPKGYLMIILQNIRTRDGKVCPLAWELALKLRETFALKQEFIWCQDQKFMGIWGYPTTYVSNVHHHYCLVFQLLK